MSAETFVGLWLTSSLFALVVLVRIAARTKPVEHFTNDVTEEGGE